MAAAGGSGPLAGLRVVELAGIGPGPFACLLLAQLGADVIRVDRATPGGGLGAVAAMDRGRRSVAVDLKHPEGPGLVLRLVETADVLVEGNRPGVAERLGLGPEECLARNPALVYARMTGWGQSGPLATSVGHDINYAGLTGALHVTGGADKPRQAVNLVADFGGGALYLVVGVLAALHERRTSGRGQVVDAAMVDGASSLLTMVYGLHAEGLWADRREANLLDGGAPFYDTYACADGSFVAVGALEPAFYAAFVEGLGVELEGGQYDAARWPQHRAVFAAAFASRTREEWLGVFAGTDACVTPVLSLEEAPEDPHLVAREVFRRVGQGHEPTAAPRFSRTLTSTPERAPAPGEDTVAVLTEVGFTAEEIAGLLDRAVVVRR